MMTSQHISDSDRRSTTVYLLFNRRILATRWRKQDAAQEVVLEVGTSLYGLHHNASLFMKAFTRIAINLLYFLTHSEITFPIF